MNEQQFKERTKKLALRVIKMVESLPKEELLMSLVSKFSAQLHRLARTIGLPAGGAPMPQ